MGVVYTADTAGLLLCGAAPSQHQIYQQAAVPYGSAPNPGDPIVGHVPVAQPAWTHDANAAAIGVPPYGARAVRSMARECAGMCGRQLSAKHAGVLFCSA